MIELPESFVEAIVDHLAPRLADRLTAQASDGGTTPWMNFKGLCEYTQLPEGTLRRLVADGTVPKHGGKSHIFFREEVDRALLNYPPRSMRKVG